MHDSRLDPDLLLPLISPEEQEKKIGIYKKEMDDFARFLKHEYYSSP